MKSEIMHKYQCIYNGKRVTVFADNRFIAQMVAADEFKMPAFLYEQVKVKLVEKNAVQVAA